MKPLLRLLLASLATCSIGVSFAQPAVDSVLADIAFHEKIAASAFSGGNRLKASQTHESLDIDLDSCYLSEVSIQHKYYRASLSERKLTDSTMTYDAVKKEWSIGNVTHYYFNESGQVIKTEETMWDQTYKVLWLRNERIIQYSTNGKMNLMSNRYCPNNGNEMRNTWRFSYVLDDASKIIEGRRYSGSGNIWNLTDMSQYQYDPKGNMTKEVNTWYDVNDSITADSTQVKVYKYSYDAKGNIITDTMFVNGRPTSLDVNTISDANGYYHTEFFEARGQTWIPVGYNLNKRDANGNNIEIIYSKYVDNNTQNVLPVAKSYSVYDEKGNCTSTCSNNWNSETNTWFPIRTQVSTFDKSGHEITCTEKSYNWYSGVLETTLQNNWYYKLKTESLQVTGGSQLTFSFDSKLVPNDSIAKCIVILPTTGESVTVQVSRAYISETDPYTLIVELSRPIADGDAYTVSLKSGVETEDGRNVQFSMDMGNAAATGVAPRTAVNETAVYPTVFTSEIHIDADADISAIQIIGINGTQWFNASQISAAQATVSLSNLPAGTYRMSVSTPKSHSSHTIVKQ